MKKKIGKGMLSVLTILGMTGCIGNEKAEPSSNEIIYVDKTPVPTSESNVIVTTPIPEPAGVVNLEEGDYIMVEMPAIYNLDVTQEYLDGLVEDGLYASAVLNEDGTVTFLVTSEQHQSMLDSVFVGLDEVIAMIVDGDDHPDITGIGYNAELTEFTVYTKNPEMGTDENYTRNLLMAFGELYQVYLGEPENEVIMEFIHEGSNEVIFTVSSKE